MSATPTPTHLLPTSCHVCGEAASLILCSLCRHLGLAHDGDHLVPGPGAPTEPRPACGHDLTNAEADRAAAEHDRRARFAYSTGATTVEGHYVDQVIGR